MLHLVDVRSLSRTWLWLPRNSSSFVNNLPYPFISPYLLIYKQLVNLLVVNSILTLLIQHYIVVEAILPFIVLLCILNALIVILRVLGLPLPRVLLLFFQLLLGIQVLLQSLNLLHTA